MKEWAEFPVQQGQLKTGQDGKGLLPIHLWCPNDHARLWDRLDYTKFPFVFVLKKQNSLSCRL